MSLPTVAIVGRPNVGKSSLFNRLLQRKMAVVHETSGVTRDRNYAVCEWAGREFQLVDTGGIVPDSSDLMEQLISDQSEFAIHESDLVLLVVDNLVGIDPTDRQIARQLSRSGQKTLLIANKVDNELLENDIYEFMKLGLGEPLPVSATVGLGIGEMLDKLVASLDNAETTEEADGSVIKVALVGRPNVGKSSFINMLLGEDRLIVSSIAGTTRDSVDTPFEFEGQKYNLIDTAGLRRKYKVRENVEFYTNLRTTRAIDGCDVAIIMIDAQSGVSTQDQRVLEQVLSSRRSAVLAINKWDLVEKDSLTADKYTKEVQQTLAKYSFLPIIYISALTGQRTIKVLSMVKEVYAESRKRIPTPLLNDFLEQVVGRKHPPAKGGKFIKFHYVTQSEIGPPTFVFFSNHPKLIEKSYIAYLTNRIRETFGFAGVPFRVKFRKK
ncbi:MAG: ribosome biogenesis GTPase Der [bacterium]|nr:ribosome biogenesis GTPase Der [bacterium]